jgi:hypothetical protein
MKAYARILLLAFCAVLMAPAQVGEQPIMISYSGTVYDALDLTDTIVISEADAKGSFGATQVRVISKFTPFVPIPAPDPSCEPTETPLVMNYARSVTTFKDHSHMFVFWDRGWICVTPGPSGQASYRGWVIGHIVGGTGRFAGATGNVETGFGGIDISGPFVAEGPLFPALGSWAGTVHGTVVFAH